MTKKNSTTKKSFIKKLEKNREIKINGVSLVAGVNGFDGVILLNGRMFLCHYGGHIALLLELGKAFPDLNLDKTINQLGIIYISDGTIVNDLFDLERTITQAQIDTLVEWSYVVHHRLTTKVTSIFNNFLGPNDIRESIGQPKKMLLEGGNLFNDTSPIAKEFVEPTIRNFTNNYLAAIGISDIDAQKAALIGSAGKKDVSSDIDMLISMEWVASYFSIAMADVPTKLQTITSQKGFRFKYIAGLKILSIDYPIANGEGNVQIDLMLTNAIGLHSYIFEYDEDTGNVLSLIKLFLFKAIAANIKTDVIKWHNKAKKLPEITEQYRFLQNIGVVLQRKINSYVDNKLIKSQYDPTSQVVVSNSPEQIVSFLLGENVTTQNIASIGDLFDAFYDDNFRWKKKRDKIINQMKSYIKKTNKSEDILKIVNGAISAIQTGSPYATP